MGQLDAQPPHTAPPAPATVPCRCSCGCTRNCTAPAFPVLAAHTRCDNCATATHIAAHPTQPVPVPPLNSKFTPIVTPSERERAEARESWEAFQQERWHTSWQAWLDSLPAKYREATTKHPQVLQRLALARKGNLDVASLLVAGELGRGKTWIAAGYASDLIRSRVIAPGRAFFTSEGAMLTLLANSRFENQTDALAKYASGRYRLIVIDDVGRGRWLSDHTRTGLYHHLLDEQYKNNNLVVLTTNMGLKSLREWIGVAAYSRLNAMTGRVGSDSTTNNGFVFLLSGAEDKRVSTTRHAVARATEHTDTDPGDNPTHTQRRR